MVKRVARWEDLKSDQQKVLETFYHTSRLQSYRGGLATRDLEHTETWEQGRYVSDPDSGEKTWKQSGYGSNPTVQKKYQAIFKELENEGLVRETSRKYGLHKLTKKGVKMMEDQFELTPQGLAVRVAASIFLLAGFIFMVLPDFTNIATTGNVIGTTVSTDTIIFFSSLGLMVIGGVLLFISFKK